MPQMSSEVKIYRQMKAHWTELKRQKVDADETLKSLEILHSELNELYESTGACANWKCPTRRFGRTEIQMPIITLGGMRQQRTWSPPDDMTLADIDDECQKNFESIVDRAMSLGINHFETARGYGSSELQFGPIIKKYSRESIILQTKVVPKYDVEEFKASMRTSFEKLQLTGDDDYVDLLSFHGINRMDHIDWILRPGGCMEVVKEYQARGKVRYIGFSTHGMSSMIVAACETGQFDYVNMHYHFVGSYTASGTGPLGSNLAVVEAANKQDMGVFIISPSDKGGKLYLPSKRVFRNCLPLTPIAFNNLWLWQHEQKDGSPAIHTLVVGAARPSDFDEHVRSAISLAQPNAKQLVQEVVDRFELQLKEKMGSSFRTNWFHGIPDAFQNDEGVPVAYMFWLRWIARVWGYYDYACERYGNLQGNLKEWDDSKTPDENRLKFSWGPGIPYRPEREAQLLAAFGSNPRAAELIEAVKDAHELFRDGGCVKRGEVPSDVDADTLEYWQPAYDLQSDVPFPERPEVPRI